MVRDWNEFLKVIEKTPKKFVESIIQHLDPPMYAIKRLRTFNWLCGWPNCWNPRIDVCFKCKASICDEHSKLEIGPKTRLEWYICKACENTIPYDELLTEIHDQDEEFWFEDQEMAEFSKKKDGGD